MDRQSFESLIESGAFGPSGPFVPENQEWEIPIPFHKINTPPFPVEALPGPLAAFVESLSESTQTPEEMAGILSLGVLATAFQSKFTVEITPDWKEPLCLYCVAVAPPGERKSAVISALTKPIYEYESEQRELEAVEIAQNQTEKALMEKALEAAKNAAARGKGNFSEKRAEALELSAQLAQFQDMLFNDNQLRRTLKLPKTKIETDTYIAVQILEQRGALNFDSLRYMAEQVEGSFTFTVLDRSNNLYIVKGDSPMCLYWFPEYGVYLYDSTEEILNKALQRSGLSLGTPTRISLSCGEILQISSSGEISRGEFDNPYLYYSHWSPYYWSDKCSSTRQKFQPYLDGYLNMIKSIAMAFGYFPEDIDQLCDLGFTPEEIEEYLYRRNLWEEI